MKLSAPIHVLKTQAKKRKKESGISSVQALNEIAMREGYNSWSLLKSKQSSIYPNSYNQLLDFFNNGDLILIGARPGQGKTIFTLGLFVKALQKTTVPNYIFTLCETPNDIIKRIRSYDKKISPDDKNFILNYSNDICADYIINLTNPSIKEGSIIVIDYLQLLDEKRINSPIQNQIESLKSYAKHKKCEIIFISQIKREIEYQNDQTPALKDIRTPNPFDLKLINKIIFLHRKSKTSTEAKVIINALTPHTFTINYSIEKNIFY